MVQTVAQRQLSARVRKAKERLLTATPRVDVQKIKIQLEVYPEFEGYPAIIKRARIFERLCAEKTYLWMITLWWEH